MITEDNLISTANYLFFPVFNYQRNAFYLGIFNLIDKKFITNYYGKKMSVEINDMMFHIKQILETQRNI